ncbi:MAG: ribosome assembly factor SBDS [Nanoarchaeota archaeon]|nr:ribosome assembly factor SBDS [Nanoarchaeota archaeon]MBU1623336.1 ribosome assembly factor SBDS [Nanoarchaeota archaeon]MBU1974059.1 ribosome assembly factor SBDS [Nanoarchaeota archaeon]
MGIISQDKVKLNLARIKKFGKTFEISVDPDKALQYKNNQITDLREVVQADNIFLDAKKGEIAPESELQQVFKTTEFEKIADLIIKEGEIQLTSEHRSQEREQKLKQLIELIRKQAVDSKTGLPIPATRIEAALEETKVQLDYNKPVEDQFADVLSKIRVVLPIKIEQKKMTITIPSTFSGKMYGIVHQHKVLKEDWLGNGDWKVVCEVPAGLAQEFIDKLNSITSGQVVVEIK